MGKIKETKRQNFEAILGQKSVKIPGFHCLRIRHLFGPFWEIPAKIRPQICLAAHIFIRPFLSFAAEESAS
jgi:hypothetical protein